MAGTRSVSGYAASGGRGEAEERAGVGLRGMSAWSRYAPRRRDVAGYMELSTSSWAAMRKAEEART